MEGFDTIRNTFICFHRWMIRMMLLSYMYAIYMKLEPGDNYLSQICVNAGSGGERLASPK